MKRLGYKAVLNKFQQQLKLGVVMVRCSALFFAAALTVSICVSLSDTKYEYEERVGALLWSLFPSVDLEERLTIVAIDEESIAAVGPWPWSRQVMAELSHKISQLGASLQLYDIVFPEPKSGDDVFLDALLMHKGVIAQVPILNRESGVRTGRLSGALEGVRCQYPIPEAHGFVASAESLIASSTGHITPIVDHDGFIRMQPPLICNEENVYPSLVIKGLMMGLGKDGADVEINKGHGFLAPSWELSLSSYLGLAIPLDSKGNMRISYRQSPDAFQVVSAARVLDGTAPRSLFNNTWVLVGATAFGLGDIVPTPHGGAVPGVEVQARMLSSLMDGAVPYAPDSAALILLLEAIFAAGILMVIASKGGRLAGYGLPLAAFCLPIGILGVHMFALSHHLWIGWFASSLFSLVAALLLAIVEHAAIRGERHRVFSHLSSYLSSSVAHQLVKNMPTGTVEASRKDLVLMCADLRNFSAYGESRPPEEAAAVLHCFFVKALEVIERFGGQIEEYNGDSILASWTEADGVSSALEAAIVLQDVVNGIFPSRVPPGLEPLALGIGIERGPTLVGSIGPAHRRSHTLLGDTVTITLRIQEMTQDLAQPILIGECAAREVSGENLESHGAFQLDGLRTPHVLFSPKAASCDTHADENVERVLRVINGKG